MKKLISLKIVFILVFTLVMGAYAMPGSWKEKVPGEKLRNHLLAQDIDLGLDLAGGIQLDFKVDLDRAKAQRKTETELNGIVEKVASKLAQRADPSGTKELSIQTSNFGDEKHILVDITADLDSEETRENLQKIVDLEFKELKEEADEADKESVKADADAVLVKIKDGDFDAVVAETTASNSQASLKERSYFQDQLDQENAELLWGAEAGVVIEQVLELDQGYMATGSSLVPIEGYSIVKIKEKKVEDREIKIPGEDFDLVRSEVSEKGDEKQLVVDVPEDIQGQVLELAEGDLSEVLESEEGYHVYKILPKEEEDLVLGVKEIFVAKTTENAKEKIDTAYERLQKKTETKQEEKLYYDELFFSANNFDPWKSTGLDGQYFHSAKVSTDPNTGISVVSIQFDRKGGKLFEEISRRNVGKPLAIFVGGELISAPTINEVITGGAAVISSGETNYLEAKKWAINLKNELEAGAIAAAPILDGEYRLKASLGEDALEASVKAGIIGLAILALWMIFAYRLLGLIAVLALSVYTTAIFFVISVNPSALLALFIALLVGTIAFMSFGNFEKNEFVSMFISVFLAIFTYIVLTSNIVLTLAGVAGIVLSIGMAVDANILIFERIKEELRDGKNFSSAISIGFERAWTSIRDSNISSLITCLILFFFGTLMIKGFAVTLALGIVISMFTAITVTRTLLAVFIGKKISRKIDLFAKVK